MVLHRLFFCGSDCLGGEGEEAETDHGISILYTRYYAMNDVGLPWR